MLTTTVFYHKCRLLSIFPAVRENIPKAIDYAGENLPKAFHYAKENIPKAIGNFGKNSDEEYLSEEEITFDIIFDIVQIINKDTKILNNQDDKHVAKFIEKKLEKNNEFYKFIDINVDFVEEIVKSIRYDVKCKTTLLNEFKNHPQIIKQKNSAIAKTVCANCGIKINDEIKNELSLQIDVVKKILELHNSGANIKEIRRGEIYGFFKREDAAEYRQKQLRQGSP